ncbi:MAG: hypothetical protein Q8P36_00825 [bacterium]|nr:hypothetical protein [bacterium]
MHAVHLWVLEEQNAFSTNVLREVEASEDSAKVYYTYYDGVGMGSYTLMTSSKDVHLGLGLLSKLGLLNFCHMLDFINAKSVLNEPFLLFMQKGHSGFLVTRVGNSGGRWLYHLSPAR